MNETTREFLKIVSDIQGNELETAAFNIREDSQCAGRQSTPNIKIDSKEDGPGLVIHISKNAQKETVYIPACVTHGDVNDLVYNDFHIGEGADVLIVAGCGIHNSGDKLSRHDGIHTFYIGKNARVKYVEKHYGKGDGNGENVMNPTTIVNIEEGGYMEMETVQIKGIDSTNRVTKGKLDKDAKIVITERIMTHGNQTATTRFEVDMDGDGSSANVISRSVARDNSKQVFYSVINGNARCNGHSECDAIIMDNAKISAIPEISANDLDASLIHEAAIGKIAGEQLIKLQTLGLTEAEAEEQIVNGFLK